MARTRRTLTSLIGLGLMVGSVVTSMIYRYVLDEPRSPVRTIAGGIALLGLILAFVGSRRLRAPTPLD